MRTSKVIAVLLASGLSGGCRAEATEAFDGAWGQGQQPDDAGASEGSSDGGDDEGFGHDIPEHANRCEGGTPPTVDVSAPLFMYYGAYGSRIDDEATMRLVTSGDQVGGEALLTINRGGIWNCEGPTAAWSDAAPWVAAGGKLAVAISACEMMEVNADHLEGLLRSGFDYVAIDELAWEKKFNPDKPGNCHYQPNEGWQDGDALANQFTALATELAARGLDRRLILYVNTYNLAGTLPEYDDDPMAGTLSRFRQVLTACRDHCRVLGSEMYMNTKRVLGEVTTNKDDHCHWDMGCLGATARELDLVAPGLNQRTITVLGMSAINHDFTLQGHPHSLCEGPGIGGGLFRQYHRLHADPFTRRQPGVGGYALTHVATDNEPPKPADLAFRRDEAECLERLNGWHGWPRAGSLPYSLIWIANSTQGTVSKIDTATGEELARYYTGPSNGLDDPSRTSVSHSGDVVVTNRAGGIVKFSARAKPGFCVDRNGNGIIDTSTGPDDLRPFGRDECMLWYRALPSDGDPRHGPRPTAWDYIADGNDAADSDDRVWVGWFDHAANTGRFRRLAGVDGQTLDEVAVPGWDPAGTSHYGPYGGAVDAEGNLWVVGRNPGPLVRIDAETLAVDRYEPPVGTQPYGLAMDAHGHPWMAGTAGNVLHFDPDTEVFDVLSIPGVSQLRGLQIDLRGRAWIATNAPCGLVQVDTNTLEQEGGLIALPGCQIPVGVAIANEETIWVPDYGADAVFHLDARTLEVETTAGLQDPYTYSDMTGAGLHLVTLPPTPIP